MKYACYIDIVGTKFLGEVEAKSQAEADIKAERLTRNASVSLCYECSHKIGELQLGENVYAEEVKG